MYRYVMGSGGGLGNLLKASEEFQQTVDWVRYPTCSQTPTVNADSRPDPNGGTTADQVDYTANTSARLMQTVTLSASTEYTFSVHARAVSGTVDFRMRNITLKAAVQKTATTTGPLTNGFTRFTYTFTTGAAGSYELALQNASGTPTARSVIFWGAMLNQGATAGNYVKTDPSFGGSSPTPAYAGFGDSFGGVTAYYSLRQFTEAETLNAIRVRKEVSSVDEETDIGFDSNGDLDTTALLSFASDADGGNVYVSIWYDQSGNGNNATNVNESEQPLVVSGGTLVTENGKAAIDFDGVDDWLDAGLSSSQFSQAFVVKNTTGTGTAIGYSGAVRLQSAKYDTGADDVTFPSGSGLYTIDNLNVKGYLNGVDETGAATTFTQTFNRLYFGSINGTSSFIDGKIQEYIHFPYASDQSANRPGIETNINDHFDIYP